MGPPRGKIEQYILNDSSTNRGPFHVFGAVKVNMLGCPLFPRCTFHFVRSSRSSANTITEKVWGNGALCCVQTPNIGVDGGCPESTFRLDWGLKTQSSISFTKPFDLDWIFDHFDVCSSLASYLDEGKKF